MSLQLEVQFASNCSRILPPALVLEASERRLNENHNLWFRRGSIMFCLCWPPIPKPGNLMTPSFQFHNIFHLCKREPGKNRALLSVKHGTGWTKSTAKPPPPPTTTPPATTTTTTLPSKQTFSLALSSTGAGNTKALDWHGYQKCLEKIWEASDFVVRTDKLTWTEICVRMQMPAAKTARDLKHQANK